MSKRSGTNYTKNKARQHVEDPFADLPEPQHRAAAQRAPIEARTETQKRYRTAILSSEVIFGVGPAGTGKTYMPVALAAEALAAGTIERIIVSRPAVEAGEQLGFLPGELEEKYEPYLAPIRQILIERMGISQMEYAIKAKKIEPVPIGFMRGMTFKNAFVIIDEAQNVSRTQMKMILTRIGHNCKMVICGDTDQCDVSGPSGLDDAVARTRGLPGVRVIEFSPDDCVRSAMVKNILKAYAIS